MNYLPRGNLLDDEAWHQRHRILLWVLALHLPPLFLLGLWLGHSVQNVLLYVVAVPALCVLLGARVSRRRVASFFVSAGLVYCSVALVGVTRGIIEAHFHFFIIIGFIALYQDWVPFLWNIVFTVISHGIGTAWQTDLIFNHPDAQANPWLWAGLHGVAVLLACSGMVVFWHTTEDEQQKTLALTTRLAETEINQRRFTSDLLVNLARRNQSMLYRQLDIINQLEEKERDPDALAELFRLDHLATRIRRNAESLLVLSGEEPTRVWSEPVRLIDVVRAAIAETEDLDRVSFAVDERIEVLGHTVTDLTHVLAELTENAVRFSPPEANVTIRTRPYLRKPGAVVLTVEDWGVGMRPDDMTAANDLLRHPRDVDLSVSQRLGLHVITRLAARHNIQVSLTPTPGTGVTAVVELPAELFAEDPQALAQQKLVGAGIGSRTGPPSHTPPSPPAMPPATQPAHAAPPAPVAPAARAVPVTPAAQSGQAVPTAQATPATPAAQVTPDAPAAQVAPAAQAAPLSHVAPVVQAPPPAHPMPATKASSSYIPLIPATPAAHPMPAIPSRPSAQISSVVQPSVVQSLSAPDIPVPRRTANGGPHHHGGPGRGADQASRGQEPPNDWTGWWTPNRLPAEEDPDWPPERVYAPVEKVTEETPVSQTAPAPIVPAAALPASPAQPAESSGPTIIARPPRTEPPADTTLPANAADTAAVAQLPLLSATNRTNGTNGPSTDSRLTRRVPLANLAPGLRRSSDTEDLAAEYTPPPDAERARDALSRFQASRQAAQQQVGADNGSSSNGNGQK